jgi:hypothetical protein
MSNAVMYDMIAEGINERILGKKVTMVKHEGGACFRAVIEGGTEIEFTITDIKVDIENVIRAEEKPSKCFKDLEGKTVHVVTMGDEACSCGERKFEYSERQWG